MASRTQEDFSLEHEVVWQVTSYGGLPLVLEARDEAQFFYRWADVGGGLTLFSQLQSLFW